MIASTGSVTVHAGAGGGWYLGGSDGHNILTATGVGTVLEAGGNNDVLTGDTTGWDYFLAGSGNETLNGGTNASGINFFFGGSGKELIDFGLGSSVLNPGTGAETVNGGGGTDQVWLTATSGALELNAGYGGKTVVSGFRIGTDHIGLAGHTIVSKQFSAGGTTLVLSAGETIQLTGVDATHAGNLFG